MAVSPSAGTVYVIAFKGQRGEGFALKDEKKKESW